MRTSAALLATSITIAVTAACTGDPKSPANPPMTDAAVTIPPEVKLMPPPASAPEELPGVDTSELNERELGLFWRWTSQLYAPCSDVAVSIAVCVKEARPCASCEPAAQFLAGRARFGDSQSEAIVAFTVRFGPDVKKVDLGDSPSKGPAGAPVTIVVWSDYECPACGYAVPKLEKMLEKHGNDVRLVHKLYPLKSHARSRYAARAALAAKKQGKYWEMEEALFAHQKALEDADLERYAKEIGLDMARFRRDYGDEKTADEIIERDRAEADKHGLTGTPFILINGRELDLGLFKLDRDLDTWIAMELAMRKKAAELRAAGPVTATPPASAAPSAGGAGTAAPSSAPAVPAAPAK
jgi:2-hydroxychromene-2-carboxylate isomerase